MHRRAFLGSLGLLAVPSAAGAQSAGKVYRLGFLRDGQPQRRSLRWPVPLPAKA